MGLNYNLSIFLPFHLSIAGKFTVFYHIFPLSHAAKRQEAIGRLEMLRWDSGEYHMGLVDDIRRIPSCPAVPLSGSFISTTFSRKYIETATEIAFLVVKLRSRVFAGEIFTGGLFAE